MREVIIIHILDFICKKTRLNQIINITFYEKELLKNIVRFIQLVTLFIWSKIYRQTILIKEY